jgi:hypothetical protein
MNPITSKRTRKVETRPDGAVIYSHTHPEVWGKFITVWDANNWVTAETLEEAREVSL